MMPYPKPLADLISFFESLPEAERRENLIDLAEAARKHEPGEGEKFDFTDVRKDPECTDKVGVFVRLQPDGRLHFAVTLGPQVQTLTRAMASILCRGLNGSTAREVLEVPQDFVPRIVGEHLVRLRSQTVYYVLSRMKEAVGRLTTAD
jgi:cysteine desulfuration protein SufE